MTLILRNLCTAAFVCLMLAICGAALGQPSSSADLSNSVQEIREAPAKPAHVQKAEPIKAVAKPAAPQPPTPVPVPRAKLNETPKPQPVKAKAPKPKAVSTPAHKPAPAEPVVAVQEQAQASPALPEPTAPHVDRVIQFAQAKSEEPAKEPQASPVKTGILVIVKLAVVLLLAYLSILALKLLYKRQESSPRIRRDLKVMDTVKLSQTSSLHVVDFNGKKLLVGSSAGQVNLLREFDQEEQVEVEDPSESRFADYLAKYSGSSFEKTPAGRVAGMLRDCADHLRNRRGLTGSGRTLGDKNKA